MSTDKKNAMVEDASDEDACCAIYKCACMFESKWSLIILRDLSEESPRRFKDFKTRNPKITDRALNQTLKRLQSLKLVDRQVEDTSPTKVTYSLTKFGKKLQPVLESMMSWGSKHGNEWWKQIKEDS